jgi:RimJ/RimL family protein N-acetyltransferase
MKYFPKLPGQRIYLSPISLDDAELYAAWLNDLSTTRYLSLAGSQVTVHGERETLERLSKGQNYAIVERGTDELLGNCGLMDVDHIHRSAEVGLFIGEETKRGLGYGSEALRLICDYGFNVLNLGNIMLKTYSYNERAVASYRKVGFREIGRRRRAHFYGGAYHDLVLMDLLAEEFGPSALPPALPPALDRSAGHQV